MSSSYVNANANASPGVTGFSAISGVPSLDQSAKLVLYGRLLHDRGYVSGCDGNLSVRVGPDRVLITPTGFSKRLMEPQDMVMVDLSGRKIDGARGPSSEIGAHLTIYKLRPDVNAVVHAHPCIATGFACAGLGLTEPVCSELLLSLGEVPLAPFAPPGTDQLGRAIAPFVLGHDAILLENHGVLTFSSTLEKAYLNMETVEHSATIMMFARLLGRSTLLSDQEAGASGWLRRSSKESIAAHKPRAESCPPGRSL